MRFPTLLRRFGAGTLACGSFLCLSVPTAWPQNIPGAVSADPSVGDRNAKGPDGMLSAQQIQEQHQQLLKALELMRRDAEANLQRYNATVDRIRKETEAGLQRFAAAVELKVDVLNRALAAERDRELQTLRRSNRLSLTVAGIIVGVSVLEILLMGWLLLRAVRRFADRLSAWPSPSSSSGLGTGPEDDGTTMLGPGNLEINLRLQSAIERLEQRLLELEQPPGHAQIAIAAHTPPAGPRHKVPGPLPPSKPAPAKAVHTSGVSLTVGEGKSLFFLPHEKQRTLMQTCGACLIKFWKRCQPARIAKGH
jgi:hypothetical protein